MTALTIAATIFFRSGRGRWVWVPLVPLAFLLSVTFTAGYQKIFDPDPRLGFLAQAAAGSGTIEAWNARLDAAMAGLFLVLVTIVVLSAARQWTLVLRGRIPIESEAEIPPRSGPRGTTFGEVPAVGGRHRCC